MTSSRKRFRPRRPLRTPALAVLVLLGVAGGCPSSESYHHSEQGRALAQQHLPPPAQSATDVPDDEPVDDLRGERSMPVNGGAAPEKRRDPSRVRAAESVVCTSHRATAGEPQRTPAAVSFGRPGLLGAHVTIAAVGDVMVHDSVQIQGYATPDGFAEIWAPFDTEISGADLTYGNLETVIAPGLAHRAEPTADPGPRFDDRVYSGFPRFNAHPVLVQQLSRGGFDILSTANNHSMDRGPTGVSSTIAELERVPIAYAGTRLPGDSSVEAWTTITSAGDLSLAWIACARHLNGSSDPGQQVLRCFEDRKLIEHLVATSVAREDVDAVIVTPHWGTTRNVEPSREQERFGRQWLEAGAVAVLGSHPHVLQPIERYVTSDGREGMIAYSLGNFFSGMRNPTCDRTAIMLLALQRDACGDVHLAAVGYRPARTRREDGLYRLVEVSPDSRDFRAIAETLGTHLYVDGIESFNATVRSSVSQNGMNEGFDGRFPD